MQRIAGLVKQDCWKVQEIQSSLHNLGGGKSPHRFPAAIAPCTRPPACAWTRWPQGGCPYFLITEQCLQPDKRAVVHQVLPEKRRLGAQFALDGDRLLGAGVVLHGDALNGLDHSEVAGEVFASGRAPFISVLGHPFGIGSK